ncbi:MAG: hypothetical protein OXF44_07275 [Anaerolineaceae bacterium]|nr:hypothetical protein [Anaerolineaceae bacterium]
MDAEHLFLELWSCKNEEQVDKLISTLPALKDATNWKALGGQEGNLGVVENQQSKPAAALVEKIVNSIDAILMRKCFESGTDPTSSDAPESVQKAIERFFPAHKYWDRGPKRVEQARDIQVLADSEEGDTRNTSIIIYDAGEGQRPRDFEQTFCSLLSGNKNEIPFVQGRYNMGGSGALSFCGRKRFQLIGSRRFDGGDFGFTLVRKHPRSTREEQTTKNSWYEFFAPLGSVPSFPICTLDLGLHKTHFQAGTIIKLYSYDTKGNRELQRDMGRSLNEYLFMPALPYFVVESNKRFQTHGPSIQFGLNDRLAKREHIETHFSQTMENQQMGRVEVDVFVFKSRIGERDVKATKEFIRKEFLKNNMSVLFTLNGQVHAHYTSEFITRRLKFDLLKENLLIHVNCTKMKPTFREELFMASRDRLKDGETSQLLRAQLGEVLKNGPLKDINKQRRDNIAVTAGSSDELLKQIGNSLPFDKELRKLFGDAMKLNSRPENHRHRSKHQTNQQQPNFKPQRYPSFFDLDTHKKGDSDVYEIPRNGSRTLLFDSDVENEYFSRSEDPGGLQLAVLTWHANDNEGGNERGTVNAIGEILSVEIQSPRDGKIKVVLQPDKALHVGDEVQIRANLRERGNPNGLPPKMFWVRITDPRRPSKPAKPPKVEDPLSIPELGLVFESPGGNGHKSWDELSDNGAPMDHNTVMYPYCNEDDVLETIYVNMDCQIYKKHRSRLKTNEQITVAENRYITSVYYHTLFLYTISRQRGYENVTKQYSNESNVSQGLVEYLQDIFASHYAQFLLAFDHGAVLDALA